MTVLHVVSVAERFLEVESRLVQLDFAKKQYRDLSFSPDISQERAVQLEKKLDAFYFEEEALLEERVILEAILSPAITEARIARLVAKNDWYYSLHMEGESVTDDMQHLDGAIQVYMSALQMEYYDPR